jgi:hypothetical protein
VSAGADRPFREWRGRVNMLLYGLDLPGRWDAAQLDCRVEVVLRDQRHGHDPEEFYRAAVAALESGEELAWDDLAEDAARDALTGIVQRLDARRPWPPPPYLVRGAERWDEVSAAPLVGRIRNTILNLGGIVGSPRTVGSGTERLLVSVVELPLGGLVGLCEVRSVTDVGVLLRSAADPEPTRAEFTAVTGLVVDPP